jgi:hypothetical protein
MYPTNSSNPSNPINPSNSLAISNNPPKTIFAGLTFSNLIETFNLFAIFDSLGLAASPQHSINPSNQILFDFESESDLERLNWQCGRWFEFSNEHATSGKQSLRMILPVEQYPGIDFRGIKEDWSKKDSLRMDVFVPSKVNLTFHVRIDDNRSGSEYDNRFDIDFNLKDGMNHISIPFELIRTNINSRPLNLKKIKRMMVFIPNNTRKTELYIDNIRLE